MDLKGLELTWLGHAAIRIRADDGTTFWIDPWLGDNPSCPGEEEQPERADAIFVTHGHFDHASDTPALARRTGAQVHANYEIADWAGSRGVENAVGSNKGGTVESVGGVRATLVDAVHSSGLPGDDGILPGGEAGGWVLEFPGGPTIYHAGDTALFGDMALFGELYSPDIALLPIGGWFTMGPEHAARAATMLGVETVIPIHYGTFPILSGTPDELSSASNGAFEVAVVDIAQPVS
jgi:L-ascorbate metabolism protein UlaG (beta-lactamase superfamily)